MKLALGRPIGRFVALLVVCTLGLQLWFLARIALMAVVDPQSTTFQRSEAWRLALAPGAHPWQQHWVDYGALPASLKRAVIASEDSGFTEHSGVEWDALEKAWGRNRARRRAGGAAGTIEQEAMRTQARAPTAAAGACAEGGRRLDHHPAISEESVSGRGTQPLCASPRSWSY